MKERNIIKDNRRAGYFSFLYYLHEKKVFHSESLAALCQYLVGVESVLRDLRWIETQILRHLVYHFDENDLSKISNLPMDYWEELEAFELVVSNLYDRYE